MIRKRTTTIETFRAVVLFPHHVVAHQGPCLWAISRLFWCLWFVNPPIACSVVNHTQGSACRRIREHAHFVGHGTALSHSPSAGHSISLRHYPARTRLETLSALR